MPKVKPFTMIDFYESLSVIDAVNVDFDESYPHQTQKLHAWLVSWLPTILAREETDRKTFFQAIPVKDGLLVANLSPDRTQPMTIHWAVDRPEVLIAVAVSITLSQCVRFRDLSAVLSHFRKDEWVIDVTDVTLDDFVQRHQAFYQTLKEGPL